MKILLLCLYLGSAISFAENHGATLKFEPNLKGSIHAKDYHQTMKLLSKEGVEIAGVDFKNKIIDILITNSEFKSLSKLGFDIQINWVNGLWKGGSSLDEEYQTSEEIEAFIKRMNSEYPDITQVISIGKSGEGKDIWAIKISDNAILRETSESTILFNSMHHAREVMTPEVAIDIIEYLLKNYLLDSKVTEWVNSMEIWVVPMVNVDGNNKVWNGHNMWRKNTRGGYGVDLNRNYPFNWDACSGSSGSTYSDTYRGPEPGSEPETKALMSLVSKIKPVFDISYHSYSELVLYPFGCRNSRTANADIVENIGKEIAAELDYTAGTPWELLYNADGGDIDWMYGVHQVIPYVIELNSRREGFQPRYADARNETVELNRKGWQLLLDKMSGAGVRGSLSSTSNEEAIEVYKDGYTLYQTYKVNPDGTFHIILNPGNYLLKFQGKNTFEKDIVIESDLVDLGEF